MEEVLKQIAALRADLKGELKSGLTAVEVQLGENTSSLNSINYWINSLVWLLCTCIRGTRGAGGSLNLTQLGWVLQPSKNNNIKSNNIMHKRTLIGENLEKRGIIGPHRCPLCCKDQEMIDHLFIEYPFSQEVWLQATTGLNIHLP